MRAQKAILSATRRRRGKGRGKWEFSWGAYTYKILKQVHPEMGLSKPAQRVLDSATWDLAKRLLHAAEQLSIDGGSKRIGLRHMQSSVTLVLPGELAKHAWAEGLKSVQKFQSALGSLSHSQKKRSRSSRAGLQFPVGRIDTWMRKETMGLSNLSASAPVFLASVLEYLSAELVELAGNASKDNKRCRIANRHLMLAIANDDELRALYGHCTIPMAGVMPMIHKALLPLDATEKKKLKEAAFEKRKKKKKRKAAAATLALAKNKSKAMATKKTTTTKKKKVAKKKTASTVASVSASIAEGSANDESDEDFKGKSKSVPLKSKSKVSPKFKATKAKAKKGKGKAKTTKAISDGSDVEMDESPKTAASKPKSTAASKAKNWEKLKSKSKKGIRVRLKKHKKKVKRTKSASMTESDFGSAKKKKKAKRKKKCSTKFKKKAKASSVEMSDSRAKKKKSGDLILSDLGSDDAADAGGDGTKESPNVWSQCWDFADVGMSTPLTSSLSDVGLESTKKKKKKAPLEKRRSSVSNAFMEESALMGVDSSMRLMSEPFFDGAEDSIITDPKDATPAMESSSKSKGAGATWDWSTSWD